MPADLDTIKKQLRSDPNNPAFQKQLADHYLETEQYKLAKEKYYLLATLYPRYIAEIVLKHEACLDKDPGNVQLRLSLVNFYLSLNHVESAILELEDILEIDNKNLSAYNILGKIYIHQEKMDEALELLERALALDLRDISLSEMLASVYLEKGRVKDAIKFYEDIADHLPGDKRILRILGDLYTRVKEYATAANKYAAMFSDDPEVSSEIQRKLEGLLDKDNNSVMIRESLAEVYTKSMKPELAVKKLEEVVNLDAKKADKVIDKLRDILKNYPSHAEATLALATAQIEKQSYSEAVELYQQLCQHHPQFEDRAIEGCRKILSREPRQIMARQFLAEAYIRRGDNKAAVEELKETINIYPDAVDWVLAKAKAIEAQEVLGYAYLCKDDFLRASKASETMLAENRKNVAAHILNGEIYLKQKLCRKALEAFHVAMMLDRENIELHKKFEMAKMKEFELQAETIKKRLVEDEWRISLHFDLAKVYLNMNKKDGARRELQAALRDQTRAASVYEILGKLHLEEGRFDLAVSAFKKGLETSSSDNHELNKRLLYDLALSYEAQGQVKQALKIFEELFEKDMDFKNVREKIDFLKKSSMVSIQNKMLIALLDSLEEKTIIGFWGREAKNIYRKQKLDFSFGQKYNNSGLEHFMKGMHPAAQEQFALAAQLDPNYVAGVNNFGITQLANKKFEEALFKFRSAQDLEPNSAIISNNLGVAYALLGVLTEAETFLDKAVGVDAELSEAWINLGDVCYASGNVKKAIDCYKKVPSCDLLGDVAKKRLLYKEPPSELY